MINLNTCLMNYRPVNKLLFFSKVTEQVVSNRMVDHMKLNCLQESSQYAYKAGHNTETMILSLLIKHLITNNIYNPV